MNKPKQSDVPQRQPISIKKVFQYLTTGLLIVSTLLCFAVVISTVVNQDANLFGFRFFYVVTGSMEPTLPIGSLLLVGECDRYEAGDIITFRSTDPSIEGMHNTHKIISVIDEDGIISYVTKGDANTAVDPEPVAHADVVGKMYFSINGGFLKKLVSFLGTPMGFFALILLPILFVAVGAMKDFRKAMKEELHRAAVRSLQEEFAREGECSEDEKSISATSE